MQRGSVANPAAGRRGPVPEGRQAPHSERFAARDFLGYEFLRSGFTADYVVEGRRFRLFVVEAANPAEAQEMLRRYLDRAGQRTDSLREGSFIVADKYNGEVALAWKGGRLGGVLGLPGVTAARSVSAGAGRRDRPPTLSAASDAGRTNRAASGG